MQETFSDSTLLSIPMGRGDPRTWDLAIPIAGVQMGLTCRAGDARPNWDWAQSLNGNVWNKCERPRQT